MTDDPTLTELLDALDKKLQEVLSGNRELVAVVKAAIAIVHNPTERRMERKLREAVRAHEESHDV